MDGLTQFLHWFLQECPVGLINPPSSGETLIAHEGVITLTLFRQPPYQVEQVILLPGSPAWPGEHRHPNVDSVECAWYNTVNFTKNGVLGTVPEFVIPIRVGSRSNNGYCVRLLPTDWHGAQATVKGACLISVQKWLNGVAPTSVGLDWEGEPTTAGHADILKNNGNSALKL